MIARFRFVPILAGVFLATSCSAEQTETYGFVATLGNDTTSVEKITRVGNRIISDAIGRSPVVMRRHWEATLAPDGTILSWTMDTNIPNAPEVTELHHSMDVTDRVIRLSRRVKSDTTNVAYKKTYAVTVPWNAFLYGSYEVLFNAAKNHTDTTHIGQYFFEGWDEGNIGYAQVKKLGNNRFSITSTGLAGAGVGTLDESGRMLSYSGEGTTYKQEAKRISEVPDIDAITTRFAADEKLKGFKRALSVRDTSRASIGGADFMIDYSRPLARGRTLVGGLIPYDRVWRTGANAATQLMISAPVSIGGLDLKPGTYTLWTLPTSHDVKLIVNRETGQWGTGYNSSYDVGRVPMKTDTLTSGVEQYTMRVEPDPSAPRAGRLVIEWGTFRWSVPVVLRQ